MHLHLELLFCRVEVGHERVQVIVLQLVEGLWWARTVFVRDSINVRDKKQIFWMQDTEQTLGNESAEMCLSL